MHFAAQSSVCRLLQKKQPGDGEMTPKVDLDPCLKLSISNEFLERLLVPAVQQRPLVGVCFRHLKVFGKSAKKMKQTDTRFSHPVFYLKVLIINPSLLLSFVLTLCMTPIHQLQNCKRSFQGHVNTSLILIILVSTCFEIGLQKPTLGVISRRLC